MGKSINLSLIYSQKVKNLMQKKKKKKKKGSHQQLNLYHII